MRRRRRRRRRRSRKKRRRRRKRKINKLTTLFLTFWLVYLIGVDQEGSDWTMRCCTRCSARSGATLLRRLALFFEFGGGGSDREPEEIDGKEREREK